MGTFRFFLLARLFSMHLYWAVLCGKREKKNVALMCCHLNCGSIADFFPFQSLHWASKQKKEPMIEAKPSTSRGPMAASSKFKFNRSISLLCILWQHFLSVSQKNRTDFLQIKGPKFATLSRRTVFQHRVALSTRVNTGTLIHPAMSLENSVTTKFEVHGCRFQVTATHHGAEYFVRVFFVLIFAWSLF